MAICTRCQLKRLKRGRYNMLSDSKTNKMWYLNIETVHAKRRDRDSCGIPTSAVVGHFGDCNHMCGVRRISTLIPFGFL